MWVGLSSYKVCVGYKSIIIPGVEFTVRYWELVWSLWCKYLISGGSANRRRQNCFCTQLNRHTRGTKALSLVIWLPVQLIHVWIALYCRCSSKSSSPEARPTWLARTASVPQTMSWTGLKTWSEFISKVAKWVCLCQAKQTLHVYISTGPKLANGLQFPESSPTPALTWMSNSIKKWATEKEARNKMKETTRWELQKNQSILGTDELTSLLNV